MWPLQSIILGKWALFWGFQHTFMGFPRWENVHFSTKPRHVTPQIDRLGKTSPVLRVSTYIYGVYKEIAGKMFIFRVNLCMWHLKSIISEKTSPVLRVSTHIYGVFKEIDGEMFIFRVNLGMWPIKSIISEK